MNVEIGTGVAQFPEKEYINEIFLAVWSATHPPPLWRGGGAWLEQAQRSLLLTNALLSI
jgi:hypothetical protein